MSSKRITQFVLVVGLVLGGALAQVHAQNFEDKVGDLLEDLFGGKGSGRPEQPPTNRQAGANDDSRRLPFSRNEIQLSFDPADLYLFDAKTEKALR